MQIIDADGHVKDRPCMDEISKYMPPGNRTQVFRAFDHIHFHFLEEGEKLVHEAHGENYVRLVALKNKYDPTNLFRLNHNIKSTM